MRDKAIELIKQAEFPPDLEQHIIDLLEPSVRLELESVVKDDLPVGSSKIGGSPDLPSDFEWPEWHGEPLGFIAQINLNDLVQFEFIEDLPDKGILYFFYDLAEEVWGFDPDNRGSAIVKFIGNSKDLIRIESLPKIENEIFQIYPFKTGIITFKYAISFPSWRTFDLQNIIDNRSDRSEWFDLIDRLQENINLLGKNNHKNKNLEEFNYADNKMFGHSDNIQGDMKFECQFASNGIYIGDQSFKDDPQYSELLPGMKNWELLLQVDSNEGLGMTWGDIGRIYFWIEKDKLKQLDFSNVWLVFQCY